MPPGAPGGPPGGQATGPGGPTTPTPNRGTEMGILAQIAPLLQLIQAMSAKLPPGSEAAQGIQKGLMAMAKHMPGPDMMNQGVMSNGARQLLLQQRQQGPQIAAQRAAQPVMQPQPQAAT